MRDESERDRRAEEAFEGGEEPPHYLVQRIREALAHDERVSELELQVKVVGSRVILGGTVTTDERRGAVEEVVREVVPGCEVRNEITVGSYGEPTDVEKIS